MPAFLVEPGDVSAGSLVLRGEEAHHLRVRRHRVGDRIDVIDGEGRYFGVLLEEMGRHEVSGKILWTEEERGESPLCLHLAAALVKGQRLDYAIEKATEVGVSSITPMTTSRAVARPGSGSKLDRWQRLAQAATKQSGRCRVPEIRPTSDFETILKEFERRCDLVLLGDPAGGQALREALASSPIRLGLLIGPEGGFAPEEVAGAEAAGVRVFSWGCSTLRADTAAVVLSALVLEEGSRAQAGQPAPCTCSPSASHPGDCQPCP